MMGHMNIDMNVTCDKNEILSKLRTNLEQHSKLVIEAREGYVKRATVELQKRLDQVKSGKINGLSISLRAPKDYSTVYKTSIAMLEAHTENTIVLSATVFRQLVEDEWDWSGDFFGSNSLYSSGTRQYGMSKGMALVDPDDE